MPRARNMGLFLPLICALQPAFAEEPPVEASTATLPPIVITATRNEAKAFEVVSPVTVVTEEEIARKSGAGLPDALRGETGVFVQQTTAGQGAPIIRGLIGSSVLMLVDGMRLNNAFFRPAPNQFYALVDPWNVERLEVVRGPGSALYGSDAMGGVINVVTPTPRFGGADWQWRPGWTGRYASAEEALMSRYALAGGREDLSMTTGLTLQTLGDRKAGGNGGRQSPSGYDVYSGDAKLVFDMGAGEVTLSTQYLRQPETPRFDELVAGFGQARPSSSEFLFEPNDRLFLHGSYRHARALGLLDGFEAHLAFQDINDDRRQRDFNSVTENRERNASLLWGLTLQASSALTQHQWLTYGVEIYRDQISSNTRQRDLATGVETVGTGRFADGSRMSSYALYLQDEIEFTERFTSTLNLRYSYYDTAIPPADRGIGADQSFDDLTGGLGLSYALTQQLRVVTNLGRGFRVPNVFDLSTLGPRPGNRFNIPNPALGPEELVSADVGLKFDNPALAGELFLFQGKYSDRIEAQLTGAVRPDGRDEVQNVNLGEVDLYGAEAGLRYRFGDGYIARGTLNYTRARQTAANGAREHASRIPPLNGFAGLSKTFGDTFRAEAWLLASNKQTRLSAADRRDPRINPAGTEEWVTVNLAGEWLVYPSFNLRMAGENLLDKRYREHGSGLDAVGRNFIVTLNWQPGR